MGPDAQTFERPPGIARAGGEDQGRHPATAWLVAPRLSGARPRARSPRVGGPVPGAVSRDVRRDAGDGTLPAVRYFSFEDKGRQPAYTGPSTASRPPGINWNVVNRCDERCYPEFTTHPDGTVGGGT